jgi:amino-acid N-acetyltransferase
MIRKATIQDIKPIHHLLHEYGKREELLARPLSQLYDHVRDFWVYVENEGSDLIGCCALQFCWEDLAEIRSLAVIQDHHGKKIGVKLVETALEEARTFKIRKIFTLTYRPGFFQRFGFTQIDRSELPLKIWSDCIICVKFPDCDETAMMMELN